jgi:hypothetical protein
MLRLGRIRLLFLVPILVALMPLGLVAQDDPNDTPLGDVARTLRKKTPPAQDVIDDDNLTKVMQEAESRHTPGSTLKFLMGGEDKGFQVAAPDATCSLSFSSNAKALLSRQYAQMALPPGEVLKLVGPATIEGDALIVSVHNRTDWHVSEVDVALTIVKKIAGRDTPLTNGAIFNGGVTLLPAVAANSPAESEVRPEKEPDVIMIYRMRAAAPPSVSTVFSTPLNFELGPDEEWHWAIVQAKGYPPKSYSGNLPQMAADGPASISAVSNRLPLVPGLTLPQNSPVSLPRNPSVESTSPEPK